MEQNEIIEGNKLIAEFMGWKRDTGINKGSDIQWTHPEYSTKLTESLYLPSSPRYMKYHTSWDWLMPVVEKIGLESDYEIGKLQLDEQWYCNIHLSHTAIYSETSSIDVIWQAVVEFIKWHKASLTQTK